MKILLAGFPKYADQPVNPAEELLQQVNRGDIEKILLPVEYDRGRKMLIEAIEEKKPDAIVVLALSPFIDRPALESYVYNEMDSDQADEVGVVKTHEIIYEDGPASIRAGFDLPSIQQYVISQGEKADISVVPGRFVANAVTYEAAYRGLPSILIHVPNDAKYPIEYTLETIQRVFDYIDY